MTDNGLRGPAPYSLLADLHYRLTIYLIEQLRTGDELKASFLSVVRSFLADNGIKAEAKSTAHKDLAALVQELDDSADFESFYDDALADNASNGDGTLKTSDLSGPRHPQESF